MKTIFIMMDSLNRHYLSAYGDKRVKTPNLDWLAARGLTFDNHWCGSMPCMPARGEMFTGRYNFLECPWGPIEPWDDCLPVELRKQKGTYSHMITDHYHYFHSGGECYHTLFDSWELERGQENDAWKPNLDAGCEGETRGQINSKMAYWRNRKNMDCEDDLSYPTPRCFQRAMEFVDLNYSKENWHLHLEVFDPHEPFDCPQKYMKMYDDDGYNGPFYNWPLYDELDVKLDTPEAVDHIRRRYSGTLSMVDHWLGKLIDKMDKHKMWKDTVLILTTDHGHLLGEHGYWAKNHCRDYAKLAHIPMIICAPEITEGKRRQGMTTTIDLMPTLLELYNAKIPESVQGKSFTRLLKEDCDHREMVIWGYFGKDVNIYDGTNIYARQSLPGTKIYQYTAMPMRFSGFIPREELAAADSGVFLPNAKGITHYRLPIECQRSRGMNHGNELYDYAADPKQESSITNPVLEEKMLAKMTTYLKELNAMPEQFIRLGL